MKHTIAALGAALALGFPPAWAAQGDDDHLAGLRAAKAAFDIKEGDARALLYRLNIIDETREAFVKRGITPQFVLAFRGPATKLVQTDLREIEPQDRPVAKQIAARLAQLAAAPGVQSIEQCGIAVRDQGTRAQNVLPQVRVVGNAWVSLIAYQAQGYAYIAP